ncbi:MAG: cysteine protease StiP domain-containing protein [Methylococcales bacterium]
MYREHFSGSYNPDDVQFLLTPMVMEDTPVHVKEALIQSGQKHYSEMLSHEALPTADYVQLFYQAMQQNQQRVAEHVGLLAKRIVQTRPQGITLVSLARAGTPIGVLLKQVLKRYFGIATSHYSISILRDKGIDTAALRYILQRHTVESLVFVDGWTGKGVIARQLADSLQDFADSDGFDIPAELYVLTDLSGSAAVAASGEDYLIPSCILNATVSGLVSRSIYTKNNPLSHDFHGCVYYQQFAEQDLSSYFINTILATLDEHWPQIKNSTNAYDRNRQHTQAQVLLQWLLEKYGVSRLNYIKPGIGEATRVLLRREARLLLLQQDDSEQTEHLRWLAHAKSIPLEIIPNLPYRAVALIKEMKL